MGKVLSQILISLYIVTAAVVAMKEKYSKTSLNESDCESSEEFCDLSRLSKGFEIVYINSSGTHWKVNEAEACNIVQLTFLEPVTIDESIVKSCKQLEMISFKGSNYDCENMELWMNVLKFVPWKNLYLDLRDTNCSSLLEFDQECGRTPDFLYQIICMDSWRKLKGSPCHLEISKQDYSVFIYCTNKSLEDSELPTSLPQGTKRLYMEDNNLMNVDRWLQDLLPQLSMVEQINFSRNRLKKLPLLPKTNNPIEHIYIEQNSLGLKFDQIAFESYLNYQNLALSFKATEWICNCYARDLVDFLIEHTKLFNDWQMMFCNGNVGSEKQRPWAVDYSHCPSREPFDYVLFLAIPLLAAVSVITIATYLDLNWIICREKKGLTNHRDPWIHTIFIKVSTWQRGAVEQS